MKRLVFLLPVLLVGCGHGGMSDLKQFVADSGNGLQGKVEPLPQVKPYEPFTYDDFNLPDPFKPRKLAPAGGGGLQPDFNRPKEPLEAYSLETLKMVGTIKKHGDEEALIKTPDNAIYHVHVGNYMGQDFGRITSIDNNQVTLQETVQDSGGDWTQRTSTLNLQENP